MPNSKLEVLVPSYIQGWKRLIFAKESISSLQACLQLNYRVTVVNDWPQTHPFSLWLLKQAVRKLYSRNSITFISRDKPDGSRKALLDAVLIAKKKKIPYVFIHLDDNVYTPHLNFLLTSALSALKKDPSLQFIRTSGRPIISHLCSPQQGNQTHISINKQMDRVTFERVELHPTRFENFTLWSHELNRHTIHNYWAIALWSTLYRTEYLEQILQFEPIVNVKHLGAVEAAFQKPEIWQAFIKKFPGKLGYINMQFSGLEMHRNRNWKELINYPNVPVL